MTEGKKCPATNYSRDNACIVRVSNPHNLIETVPEPVDVLTTVGSNGVTRIAGLSQGNRQVLKE